MTIPSKDLVGQDAKLVDGVYTDAYMKAINELVSPDTIFGADREEIVKGTMTSVGKFVMGTLGTLEHEYHLASLVMTAAEAREWRAVVREPGRHMAGLDAVVDKGFGHVATYNEKTFLLPSAHYLTYCLTKL
jgi:hypothetical protein